MGKPPSGKSKNIMEINGKVIDFRSIIKEVQLLGSSDMTWKERKDLQNKKVVSLGGKATKQQRLPLSVARLQMKNHKIREQKRLQQELLCGRSGESMVKTSSSSSSSSKQRPERRKLEDSVLKSSQGVFRNGVLDVKHLLKTTPTARDEDHGPPPVSKGRTKQKGGNKNHGKKKGGGKQRH